MFVNIKKKTLSLFSALLTVVLSLSGQHTPGSWKIFPMSGESYQQILDTPNKVYYLTGNSLYSYDKEYQETLYYTPGSTISDSGISNVYYNVDNKYLMIVYTNGNIDLLYDNGNVVNMPEIKDANLTGSKNINHVMFYNDKIYLATDFGIVIYDDQKLQVIESGIYNKAVSHIMATDEYLFVVVSGKLYSSSLNDRHNSLEKFEYLSDLNIRYALPLGSGKFLTGSQFMVHINEFDVVGKQVIREKVADMPNISLLLPYKDGFYGLCDHGIFFFDKSGLFVERKSLTTEIQGQLLSLWSGIESVWAADNSGVANYDLSSSIPTVLSDKYKPESSMLFNAGFCTPSWDGLSVYITCMGMSDAHPAGDPNGSTSNVFICERYDWESGEFTQVHPEPLQLGGAGVTAIDPVDPSIIYHTNNFYGLLIIKNEEVIYTYDKTNSPLYFIWGTRVFDVTFDNKGNLWVGYWRGSDTENSLPEQTVNVYKILPAEALEKLRRDPASVTMNDWIDSKFTSSEPGKCDMHLIFSSRSNKGLYIRGSWDGPIIGVDTKGTTETSDDTHNVYTAFADQDGTVTSPTFKPCIVEDNNGHFWIGTSSGVFVVTDLNQIGTTNSDNISVRRPKVARNDGTNYADYLLASETILGIAVDHSNRKWIATEASGVYLVNEDGTEIIAQYTVDNSPLLSNCIYTVACNPNGNDVLIGTPNGMFLYSSTSAPAAADFSEVYTYPNPVRPEYTGWITINGLMEDSFVKIADMQGNVLWETMSEGGMAVWDGCNRSGERVRSGVYLVFASKTEGDTSSGAVAKIVVIN